MSNITQVHRCCGRLLMLEFLIEEELKKGGEKRKTFCCTIHKVLYALLHEFRAKIDDVGIP